MLPEGTLCEVIDNNIYMSPSPTKEHQRLLLSLASQIQAYVQQNDLGEIFISPYDVYLNQRENVVQPDIFFLKKDRQDIAHSKGIYGAPDLVIEILSTNKIHDQERKLELYRQNHVPEYFIVDPETKEVWHYLLDNGTYREVESQAGKLLIEQLGLTVNF